jgi:hypothetical protein
MSLRCKLGFHDFYIAEYSKIQLQKPVVWRCHRCDRVDVMLGDKRTKLPGKA